MRRVKAAILAAILPGCAAADAPCRQALALGLDVSASVDALEYRLQLDGLATALDGSGVRNLLLAMPSRPVELLIFEWSGLGDSHVLLDWTPVRSPADLAAVQEILRATTRRAATPGTALGEAMRTGRDHLERRAHCGTLTLDISGDGRANQGPPPAGERDGLAGRGITVNALVIGADAPALSDTRHADIAELSSYFRTQVITGDDAFVQTALGYGAYAEAMERKLEKELKGLVVSQRPDETMPGDLLKIKMLSRDLAAQLEE